MLKQPDALPRRISDAYVDALVELDPILGTALGVPGASGALPDFSPDGRQAVAELARSTLAQLAAAAQAPGADSEVERRCATLLKERLGAELAHFEAGEHLRAVDNLSSPLHQVRKVFSLMPVATEDDWRAVARRLDAVPAALAGYRASLDAGAEQGLRAAPRQVAENIAQLDEWLDTGGFGRLAADVPEQGPRKEVETAARVATGAVAELRDWFAQTYAGLVDGQPDAVGGERYARFARLYTGAEVDPDEAYAYGWSEFHRLLAEMRAEAGRIRPGAAEDPWEVLAWLDRHGRAVEGVEETRLWLQGFMDEAVEALDGTYFELAEPVRRVESRIAPPGGAAAPYYTQPSVDFSRPGRTWLPTLGRTRFPTHHLVSTWYHEGVPGHHLQLAHWTAVAGSLSHYQTKVGKISATTEGWALYAERLMDELGFYTEPQDRLGHLDAQMMRALRVVVDLGMHLRLDIPTHSPFAAGRRWTPALAREFLGRYSGRPPAYLDSEIVRYLGRPAQAITYKLGERAWLQGRETARARQGTAFDLKRWHMAALSLGSLGLDDLRKELGHL
ncbi:DUF885 domain-containing protein [Streptomyces sp. NPDC056257]|uniref:DUF885 domain-containing protein n=1 Tax=Streptomyces sp. NPDC056257 TaxID=3345765 RepID=UPI0035D9DA82